MAPSLPVEFFPTKGYGGGGAGDPYDSGAVEGGVQLLDALQGSCVSCYFTVRNPSAGEEAGLFWRAGLILPLALEGFVKNSRREVGLGSIRRPCYEIMFLVPGSAGLEDVISSSSFSFCGGLVGPAMHGERKCFFQNFSRLLE